MEALKAQFSEEEQVKLTLLIVAINGWNRIQVGFRAVHPIEQRRAGVMARRRRARTPP